MLGDCHAPRNYLATSLATEPGDERQTPALRRFGVRPDPCLISADPRRKHSSTRGALYGIVAALEPNLGRPWATEKS
jgi:hypothetical protein